jgi:hypothetical protein
MFADVRDRELNGHQFVAADHQGAKGAEMPKQKFGTGNKRAVLQRPGTSYTSPNAIKLQQRRAAALDYRLQGHAYHWIAKALGCHPLMRRSASMSSHCSAA